jgi:hypothetical protein
MSNSSIHPPGEKLKKAIREFSERLEEDPALNRNKVLQQVTIQFDLSPREADFLKRQCDG